MLLLCVHICFPLLCKVTHSKFTVCQFPANSLSLRAAARPGSNHCCHSHVTTVTKTYRERRVRQLQRDDVMRVIGEEIGEGRKKGENVSQNIKTVDRPQRVTSSQTRHLKLSVQNHLSFIHSVACAASHQMKRYVATALTVTHTRLSLAL